MPGRPWSVTPHVGMEMCDVIAVLEDERSAVDVARAAARQARTRSARVHFLRLIDASRDPRDVDGPAGQSMVFQAALRALRDETRVPVTFETLRLNPSRAAERLVEIGAGAAVLVLGRDHHPALEAVRRLARCDVLIVGAPAQAPAQAGVDA